MIKLPDYVKNCIDALCTAGFSAYAVGGAVRDSLIGVCPNDWDVTTSATPDEILSVFADYRTVPTGIKHGTVTVLFESGGALLPIEVTTFRVDGDYLDSRHPASVSFSRDVRDDLSRRDFTVNAMAYSEREGLIDAFGGEADLKRGIIRTVGDAEQRFSEDALRILRAFRFAAQLGFEIEEKTLDGAKNTAHLLKNIARERISAELKRLLASRGVVYALEKMVECGVWGAIFDAPEPQGALIKSLARLSDGCFELRMAVILNGIGGEGEILESLRLSNSEKRLITRLCGVRDFELCGNIGRSARHFLQLYGNILPLALEALRFYNGNADSLLAAVLEESEKRLPLTVAQLALKGGDILPLAGGDHRRVGEILKLLLERVIDDPSLNEKEKLIEIAKKSLE